MRFTRRSMLPLPFAVLVGSVVSTSPRVSLAVPTPPDGLYVATALHPTMHPAGLAARRGTRPVWVELGAALHVRRALLFAADNANSRFQLLAWVDGAALPGDGALVLRGAPLVSESHGSDNDVATVSFWLDAAQAAEAARLLRIPRQDRHPAAEQVTGTFAPSAPSFRVGEPVEVVLTLRNPAGAPAAQRSQGGRQRGPRDNQFSFVVRRDGREVPLREGMDFGGRSQLLPLAPGGSAQLRAPLALWADLSVPGRYAVECRYETEFSPENSRPYEEAQRGAAWDRVFTGTVQFDVR